MKRSLICASVAAGALALTGLTVVADGPNADFGAWVQAQLRAHSEELFGFKPLKESAVGPYDGLDNLQAIQVAQGLKVSLVSSSTASAADQIALWPNDDKPTHLFVCDEETSNPAVQRIDLSQPPATNATTIVTGLNSCDPVRRTAWGTIVVGEEAGATGGLYELIDPVHITTAIAVTNRTTGANTDPLHLVKRMAVGSLSFESLAIRPDGTMIYGDELAPNNGNAGGGIYKFVPAVPFAGNGPITVPGASPFVSGTVYGLRVAAANNSSNYGQGAEIGKGAWVAINMALTGLIDGSGNINLRVAQASQKFTGYYRPEDMDIDPIAAKNGVFRACWANTGRLNFAGGTTVENSAVYGEVMCLVEEPNAAAATGATPAVTRFVAGSQQLGMPDNVAFQPHTGNLVVLEDGPTSIMTPNGEQPRGNDLWICLPDGADDDVQTDGCVRFASIRDTSAEPTGFIFLGSGEEAFVNIQHRAINDSQGNTNHGALIKISGFRARPHDDDHDDHDHEGWR